MRQDDSVYDQIWDMLTRDKKIPLDPQQQAADETYMNRIYDEHGMPAGIPGFDLPLPPHDSRYVWSEQDRAQHDPVGLLNIDTVAMEEPARESGGIFEFGDQEEQTDNGGIFQFGDQNTEDNGGIFKFGDSSDNSGGIFEYGTDQPPVGLFNYGPEEE